MRIGEFALRHGMSMPDRYKRSVACFLREDIAEIENKTPGTVELPLLTRIEALTDDADMLTIHVKRLKFGDAIFNAVINNRTIQARLF